MTTCTWSPRKGLLGRYRIQLPNAESVPGKRALGSSSSGWHYALNCVAARPAATLASDPVTTVPPAAPDASVGTRVGTCLIVTDAGHLIAVRRRPGPPRL